jgi:hypothetical protein
MTATSITWEDTVIIITIITIIIIITRSEANYITMKL